MQGEQGGTPAQLWFDVERRYKTMECGLTLYKVQLWFDVERRYKTIQQR